MSVSKISAMTAAAIIFLSPINCEAEGTLLSVNRDGGSVSFIDLVTGIEIARVPVGPVIPHEVAVSADGRFALTTEYGPNNRHGRHIVLIDVANASIAKRIDIGPNSRPHTALFLSDGRHAVATMQESDQLALVDLQTGSVVRTYPTGGREGHMVRLSPDNTRAYVTSRGAEGTLSVIFLQEERDPVVIPTGAGAEGLAVSPVSGEIWVANRSETSISIIDAESLQVVAKLDSRISAGRVEISPDGRYAIVPNGGGGRDVPQYLRLYDVTERQLIMEVPLRDGEAQPGNFGIWIHDGKAYASDPGQGTIQAFNLDDLGDRTLLIENREAPDGLAWSPLRVNVMVTE